MANGVNKVIVVGNLGRDPDVRFTEGGMSICNFSVAIGERRKGKDGEWVDQTEWVKVVCFGKTAENAGKYLAKGRQVYVEGRMQTRKWADRDGNDKWTTEVAANQVLFLGGKGEGKPKAQEEDMTYAAPRQPDSGTRGKDQRVMEFNGQRRRDETPF